MLSVALPKPQSIVIYPMYSNAMSIHSHLELIFLKLLAIISNHPSVNVNAIIPLYLGLMESAIKFMIEILMNLNLMNQNVKFIQMI